MSFVMTQPDAGANLSMGEPEAAAVHEVFTTTFAISADSYAATEAANAIAAG